MEIKGKIIAVLEPQGGISKDGNEWKVQPYVLETTDTEYPKKVYFEIFGAERINRYPLEEGDEVTVSFDLESREFNGRWYTTARAWRVAVGTEAAPAAQPVEAKVDSKDEGDGDLPF